MSDKFTLREMQPSDGLDVHRLMENDPPISGMSMTTHFLVDPYQAWQALKPTMIGVVAQAVDSDELVGTATVNFDHMQFDGQVLPVALLENLKVHHAYRGQGLGTKLAQWRIEKARERFGDNVAILTGTTSDNAASLATMNKWAKQFLGPILLAPRATRTKPPTPLKGVTVRPAEMGDFAEIADKSNRFYAPYNAYTPFSAETIEKMLQITPQVYYYRIAVDASGKIVAGAMISDRPRLMVDEFHNVPLPLRLVNTVAHIFPADNVLRAMEVVYMWFDQLSAAKYLWEYLRWEFRDRANNMAQAIDPRSPLMDVVALKLWHQPRIEIRVAIQAPIVIDTDKWISNFARG